MPHCPNCGDEYRPGFTRCADCDVELVTTDPSPREDATDVSEPFIVSHYESIDPVKVFTAPSRIHAEVVLSALRSAGVRAYVAGTGVEHWTDGGGIGQMMGVVGPLNDFRIMVHPEDAEDARGIIEEALGTTAEDDLGEAATGTSVEPDVTEGVEVVGPEGETIGVVGDRPDWRTDRRRNRSVVRGIAIFLLLPMVAVALSWLFRFFEYLVSN